MLIAVAVTLSVMAIFVLRGSGSQVGPCTTVDPSIRDALMVGAYDDVAISVDAWTVVDGDVTVVASEITTQGSQRDIGVWQVLDDNGVVVRPLDAPTRRSGDWWKRPGPATTIDADADAAQAASACISVEPAPPVPSDPPATVAGGVDAGGVEVPVPAQG